MLKTLITSAINATQVALITFDVISLIWSFKIELKMADFQPTPACPANKWKWKTDRKENIKC